MDEELYPHIAMVYFMKPKGIIVPRSHPGDYIFFVRWKRKRALQGCNPPRDTRTHGDGQEDAVNPWLAASLGIIIFY